MIPLFKWRKSYFSTTSMLADRYFGFPPLHKKANKELQRWRVLAFYRIAPCLKAPNKRSQHIDTTYPNIFGPTFASSGQTIATFQRNISQLLSATCCTRLASLLRTCYDTLRVENRTSAHAQAQHCCTNLAK